MQRLIQHSRRQAHQRLDDQGGGHVDTVTPQQVRQGGAHAAGHGAVDRSQQIGAQQHHGIPQIHVAAGGRGDHQHRGRHIAQGDKQCRQHQHFDLVGGGRTALFHHTFHVEVLLSDDL